LPLDELFVVVWREFQERLKNQMYSMQLGEGGAAGTPSTGSPSQSTKTSGLKVEWFYYDSNTPKERYNAIMTLATISKVFEAQERSKEDLCGQLGESGFKKIDEIDAKELAEKIPLLRNLTMGKNYHILFQDNEKKDLDRKVYCMLITHGSLMLEEDHAIHTESKEGVECYEVTQKFMEEQFGALFSENGIFFPDQTVFDRDVTYGA
jgi:hypothetical protein